MPPASRAKETARWAVKTLVFLALTGLALFLPAGTTRWGAAWAYLGLIAFIQVLDALVLGLFSPDLLVERARVQSGTAGWDRWLSPAMALAGPLLVWIAAGLDRRLGGAVLLPDALQTGALALAGLCSLLGVWAIGVNRFFSATVRIQAERGHQVISAGPYRLVRHPGYLSALLFYLLTPLALGSLWAYLPVAALVGVIFARTALEDATLRRELPGYAGYARRVRSRLLPGLW